MVSFLAQATENFAEIFLTGKADGSGAAHLRATVAAGNTTVGMRHKRPVRFWIPLEDALRTEIHTIQIHQAGIRIDGGKPREFFAWDAGI